MTDASALAEVFAQIGAMRETIANMEAKEVVQIAGDVPELSPVDTPPPSAPIVPAGVKRGPKRNKRWWSDEAVAALVRLRGEGRTASQIAQALKVTRNAVIGQLNRRGLGGPNEQSASERKIENAKAKAKAKAKAGKKVRRSRARPHFPDGLAPAQPSPVVSEALPPSEMAPATAAPLLDLAPGCCRWPYGDGPFVFCAARAHGPYCAGHARMAYRPPITSAQAEARHVNGLRASGKSGLYRGYRLAMPEEFS